MITLSLKAWLCRLMMPYALLLPVNDFAQQKIPPGKAFHLEHKVKYEAGKGPNDFPQLIFANIPGAPKLTAPKVITGRLFPVIGEGKGWAAPFVHDWNGDGKKDLLVGEFWTGEENSKPSVGNFVRVYNNSGTDDNPFFSGVFQYATADENLQPATPLSVYTWCCIGFTPRIIDLNKDGYPDLLTGQYTPGDATWFRGSETGFHTAEKLEQVDAAKRKQNLVPEDYEKVITDPTGMDYWQYSAMAFGDLDGDSLDDMVIGGGGLRISKNIGTATSPKFGPRELLLDINEKPLYVFSDSNSLLPNAVPYVADWNSDKVLDLLVTCYHSRKGNPSVIFFQGVKTAKGIRFQSGVSLFTVKAGGKAFPGSYLNLCVSDWNNDGVNDLIIGARVPTINGKFQHHLAWAWENDTKLAKMNPAYQTEESREKIRNEMKFWDSLQHKLGKTDEQMLKDGSLTSKVAFEHYYGSEESINVAHKGYVYVLLGKKEN